MQTIQVTTAAAEAVAHLRTPGTLDREKANLLDIISRTVFDAIGNCQDPDTDTLAALAYYGGLLTQLAMTSEPNHTRAAK